VKVFKFSTKEFVGYISYMPYLAANATDILSMWAGPGSCPAVRKDPLKSPNDWTTVSNGAYSVKIVAEKYLGPGFKRNDLLETWVSPKIIVKAV